MRTATQEPTLDALDAPVASRRGLARILDHPNWLSLAIYSALSLIADLPSWPGDPDRVPTCACIDTVQTIWYLRYTPYAISHGQNLFATHLMQYPRGVDLAQNTAVWLLGLITAPLTVLVSPVASLNLLRFLAFVLSAFSMYWVLRHFVRFAPAAFVGGLIYGFSPYVVTQGSLHLDLMFVPLPPLIFFGLYEILVHQASSPWRWGLATGLFAVAQFYISAEVLATTALVAAVAFVILVLTCARSVPTHWRHALAGLAIGGAATIVLIAYPVWMMSHGPNHYSGPAQGYYNPFNNDVFGAVVPTIYQHFGPHSWKVLGSGYVQGNIHEDDAFLGAPLLAIATYFVLRYWRRLWPVFLALVAIAVYVLSLGWKLVVDGRTVHFPIQMPFIKLEHFPAIANIEPVRLALYTAFFVACIVALGVDAYADDVRVRRLGDEHPWRSSTVALGRVGGIAVAFAAVIALVPSFPYSNLPLAHYGEIPRAELAVVPKGAVVMTYPFASPYATEPLFWQQETDMNFKIIGGYSLVPGPNRGEEFPQRLLPVQVEAIFEQTFLKNPTGTLPAIIASKATVTPHFAWLLRIFARRNHIDAIVIATHRKGSGEVSKLVRLAFGPPDAVGSRSEIWLHIPKLLHHRPAYAI